MDNMDRRKLHHIGRYIRHIHAWYFLIAAVLFGFMAVHALQQNNREMGVLREAVFTADRNNGDVESALRKLQVYVYDHMNTSVAAGPNATHPPIQLQYTYERLQAAQQAALGQNNSTLYNQALEECNREGQTTSGQATINCIESYTSEHGVQLADIPDALYKFDFRAAKWSPDLAGWSLVLTVLCLIGFILSVSYSWMMKRYA